MAIFAGTVGFTFNFTLTGIDISAPGVFQVLVTKPGGSPMTWTPTLDSGPGGTSHYVTVAGDIDAAGSYTLRPKWWPTGLTGNWRTGPTVTFTVEP